MVESILQSNYNMYVVDGQVSLTETNPKDTHSHIWRLVSVDNKYIISNSHSEIEHFLRLPFINYEKDPLDWWYGNRYSLPCMYRMACDYLYIPT